MEEHKEEKKDSQPSDETQVKLEEYKKQAEEYLNNWKRERADFVNYKKEEARRVEEVIKFANEGLVLEMIDVLDNLQMAVRHVPEEMNDKYKEWLKGLNQAMKGFEDFLKTHGVEKISTDNFDPAFHEAIEHGEGEIEEIRRGYTMHGKVIRPSRVKFIKNN